MGRSSGVLSCSGPVTNRVRLLAEHRVSSGGGLVAVLETAESLAVPQVQNSQEIPPQSTSVFDWMGWGRHSIGQARGLSRRLSFRESTNAGGGLASQDGRQPPIPELHRGLLLRVIAVAVVDAGDVFLLGMIEDSADDESRDAARSRAAPCALTRATMLARVHCARRRPTCL